MNEYFGLLLFEMFVENFEIVLFLNTIMFFFNFKEIEIGWTLFDDNSNMKLAHTVSTKPTGGQ